MFNLLNIRPDYRNLSGVLLVVAQHRTEVQARYQNLPDAIYYQRHEFICPNIIAGELIRDDVKDNFDLHTASLSEVISEFGRYLDGYDLGIVNSQSDWAEKVREIAKNYSLEWHLQKYDPGTEICRVPAENREYFLKGIHDNLAIALNEGNIYSRLRAESMLSRFLSRERFSKTLDELRNIAGEKPYWDEAAKNRKELVLALAMDNISQASHIQRKYEELIEKANQLPETIELKVENVLRGRRATQLHAKTPEESRLVLDYPAKVPFYVRKGTRIRAELEGNTVKALYRGKHCIYLK